MPGTARMNGRNTTSMDLPRPSDCLRAFRERNNDTFCPCGVVVEFQAVSHSIANVTTFGGRGHSSASFVVAASAIRFHFAHRRCAVRGVVMGRWVPMDRAPSSWRRFGGPPTTPPAAEAAGGECSGGLVDGRNQSQVSAWT